MERFVKVCNIPQGKGYVPGIRIAGNYLTELNFSVNDPVFVNCKKNRITIKKASKKDLVKRMTEKNPSLSYLIEKFELKI